MARRWTLVGVLAEPHAQNIALRNLELKSFIKPSESGDNLAINLEPRVMDFGLARLVEQDSEMTLTGMAIGSPSYMAQGAGCWKGWRSQCGERRVRARSDSFRGANRKTALSS